MVSVLNFLPWFFKKSEIFFAEKVFPILSKINKITFSIDVEIPSENNVEDALKAKKIEDIYHSLYNFGEIEIDIENKEIIGRLEENIFTFDLLNGNLKNIEIKK